MVIFVATVTESLSFFVNRISSVVKMIYNIVAHVACHPKGPARNSVKLILIHGDIIRISNRINVNSFCLMVYRNTLCSEGSQCGKVKSGRLHRIRRRCRRRIRIDNCIFRKLRRIGLILRDVFNREFRRFARLGFTVVPAGKGIALVSRRSKGDAAALITSPPPETVPPSPASAIIVFTLNPTAIVD